MRTSQVICFCSNEPAPAASIALDYSSGIWLIQSAFLWLLIFHGFLNKSAYFSLFDPQVNGVGSIPEWEVIVPSWSKKPQKKKLSRGLNNELKLRQRLARLSLRRQKSRTKKALRASFVKQTFTLLPNTKTKTLDWTLLIPLGLLPLENSIFQQHIRLKHTHTKKITVNTYITKNK